MIKFLSKLQKESGSRVLQMSFERKQRTLIVLNSDSTVELFKVNIDNPDSILKKLVRAAKKKSTSLGKRSHSQIEETKVDKKALKLQIQNREYDMALHFSRKLKIELDHA